MKVTLVAGLRELLTPRPVELGDVLARLRTPGAEPFLLPAGWACESDVAVFGPVAHDHAALYADPADIERRVDLFLDYVADHRNGDASPVVILPFDSLLGDAPLGDLRLRHFHGRAEERFGPGSVRVHHLGLGGTTAAVLRRLAATSDGSVRPASGIKPIVIEPGTLPRESATLPGMQHNFAHAVLALGERMVKRESVFNGSSQVERISALMAATDLRVRTDLDPERALAELRPGGQLFQLLTSPVPPPAPPPGVLIRPAAVARPVED